MKNVTSFETSRALKEANFPQPEPEFGQIWYDAEGTALLIFSPPGDFVTVAGTVLYPASTDDLFYAPTATDILRYLPGKMLVPGKEADSDRGPAKDFGVFYMDDMPRDDWETKHWNPNPAEAGAAAWLQIQKPAQ